MVELIISKTLFFVVSNLQPISDSLKIKGVCWE
jgi:hypothetical protein